MKIILIAVVADYTVMKEQVTQKVKFQVKRIKLKLNDY